MSKKYLRVAATTKSRYRKTLLKIIKKAMASKLEIDCKY